MAAADEVVLWKAPQPGRDAVRELINGFDPQEYPGNGPYFATVRAIAHEYLRFYKAGLQVIYLPRTLFDDLIRQSIILPDRYYTDGESYHVPAAGLVVFNMAIEQGSPNEYYP